MKKFVYLFLIIAAAFIVRAIGINYGLPFLYHDDEPILVNYALAYSTGDFNPHVFNISPLLTYILFFIYGILFIAGHILGYFHNVKDFAYLYLTDPSIFFIIGRYLYGVTCGTASVFLLYVLGKKYFNQTVGILASIFLAFNFIHVRDSHYIYFDIPLTFCILIFFIKAHDFFVPVRRKDYIQLGALLGLVMSVKYQGMSLLLPFIVIVLYNFYMSREVTFGRKLSDIAWGAVAFLAVMFVANPFLFMNLSEFVVKAQKLPYMPVSSFYHIKASLFGGCGVLMTLFGIIGIFLSLAKRNKGTLLALYVIFYYLLIIKITQPGERLVLPMVPFALLFAASVVIYMKGFIKSRLSYLFAIFILSTILIYPSLVRACYSDLLFTRADTRTQAYRWIKENIKPKSRIALDATASWFPRLEKDREQIKELKNYFGSTSFKKPSNSEETKLRLMLDNPYYPKDTYCLFYLRCFTKRGFLSIYPCINVNYQEMEKVDVGYAVLSNILTQDEYGSFVEELEKHATPVKVFSPYKDGVSRMKSMEVATVPAAAFTGKELFDRKCYGPYIKVYKITK